MSPGGYNVNAHVVELVRRLANDQLIERVAREAYKATQSDVAAKWEDIWANEEFRSFCVVLIAFACQEHERACAEEKGNGSTLNTH
jgi:hypothetical protein